MMMASSQVEIVPSSPFGCVLRNHGRNRNDRYRDSNVRVVQAAFEKNFKDLVRDHMHGCRSLPSHENSQDHISSVSSWVSNEQTNGNKHKLRLLNKNQNNDNNNVKNEEPLPMTPTLSGVLDRWVTKQAQEMKASTVEKSVASTLENGVNEEEPLLVPSNSNTSSSISSMTSNSNTKNVQNLPTNLGKSPVAHNLGASSLVQIWEARLNRSNSINSNQNQSQSMGIANNNGTSSGLSCNENNASSTIEEPPRDDSVDEKFDNRTKNEDLSIDWESQSVRTAVSEPPSTIRTTFDAKERERRRVVDIIKRLTNHSEDGNDYEQSNSLTDALPRESKHYSSSSPEQAESRCLLVVNSPRLRGRQAFRDLLMQLKRDRNKELDSLVERQAVTKFSQRGRLQSMLRLRCLQRSTAIQDKCRGKPQAAQVNRSQQGSTILHLREKFSTSPAHPMTSLNDSATQRCPNRVVPKNSVVPDKTSTSKIQNNIDNSCQNVSSSAGHQDEKPVNRLVMNINEDILEETKPPSDDAPQQKRSLEIRNSKPLKTTEATTSLEGRPQNEMEKKQDSNSQNLFLDGQEIVEIESSLNVYIENAMTKQQDNHQEHLFPNLQEPIETTSFISCIENEIAQEHDIGDQQQLYLDSQEIAETVTSYNDQDDNEIAEEIDDQYQEYFSRRYDCFSSISRPRSYWEGLRQAWYQEVLNTTSKDEEIHQLLQRGKVSSFLASDFRDKMDRLMMSRVQMQADQDESDDDGERMVQVMTYLQRHTHVGVQNEERDENIGVQDIDEQEDEEAEEEVYEDEEEDDDDDENKERSLITHQYHEAHSYFSQSTPSIHVLPSPSLVRSWSFPDDNETGDNSDNGGSTYSPPPTKVSSPPQYCRGTPKSSPSVNRPSLEMELICNLRGHIEQLHQEMAKLRKTVMSCMNMQMNLQQQYLKRKVHSVGREGKNLAERAPRKRSCCICKEMEVDSLLYRCGHMCTCMKCAQELQWSSGKCPICGLPILDVVHASMPEN